MGIDWESLETREHPTLEAVIQVLRAIDQLHDKPETQAEADAQLEQAAKRASLLGTRRADGEDHRSRGTALKVGSLLKKIERLDSCLGTSLGDIFRGWMNAKVGPDDWGELRERHLSECRNLEKLAEAYRGAIRHPSVRAPLKINVLTTRLLDVRFWPSVLNDFYEQTRRKKRDVQVELSTIEPHQILERIADKDVTQDLVVTYGDERKKPQNCKSIRLHRCLLGAEGKLNGHRSISEILKKERIGALRAARRTIQGFPWEDLEERIDYRGTTLAVHAYCRSGCGIGVSHVEFLDELEQKELDVLELEPDKFYGQSVLICFRPPQEIEEDESPKAEYVRMLEGLIHQRIDEIKNKYERSKELTRLLEPFRHSYSSATTYLDHDVHPQTRVDVWRGNTSLKVTPGLFVNGSAEVFGDAKSPDRSRQAFQSFRLFGRVRFARNSRHGQMVLRAMNRENDEIVMASFLVEEIDGELRCPGLKDPCLIGHWIGTQSGGGFAAPNAGFWIWHEKQNLGPRQITKLVDAYRSRFPISILPESIKELFGTTEIGA